MWLRPDLVDYSHVCIAVKGTVTIEGDIPINRKTEKLTLKIIYQFKSCIKLNLKINNTLICNAEDLDIITTMHNLLKYGNNFSMTSRSLWNCHRDEVNDDVNETVADSRLNKTTTSKYFEYETKNNRENSS